MRIYIKAPYWRNSDFFAHVAEHYVVHQLLDHKERFFRLQGMIEAHTCKSGFYISLPDGIVAPKECISWCAVEQINKSMLKLEINALMQELRGEGKNTGDLLSIFAGKHVMGKDFSLRGMQKFPLKEIEEYIIQWCNPQHMTVVDDAGKMLHQGRSYTTLIQEQNTTWKKHTCKARGLNFYVCTTKSTSPHTVCVALLLEYLLDAAGHRQQRIQQGNYYAPIGYSDFFPKGVMVARQMGAFTIDKEWFESGKEAFLQEYAQPKKATNVLTDISLLYDYDFKKQFTQTLKGVTWEEIERKLI